MLNLSTIRMYVLVAIGGAIGSIFRYWLGDLGATLTHAAFPWGTLWVNWIGCFVIGFFSEATKATAMMPASTEIRNFMIVGICGGFTTFSSFSLGALTLWQYGLVWQSASYILLSAIGCLFAVTFGVWLVRFTHLTTEDVQWRE